MTIWIDGDNILSQAWEYLCSRALSELKRAQKLGALPRFTLCLVASELRKTMACPQQIRRIHTQSDVPRQGTDISSSTTDDVILDQSCPGDMAITQDIPLAEKLVNKGLVVLNDRGIITTRDNAAQRRSMRDAIFDLKRAGIVPLSGKATSAQRRRLHDFANAFDRVLTAMIASRE